jgi:NTE family protein
LGWSWWAACAIGLGAHAQGSAPATPSQQADTFAPPAQVSPAPTRPRIGLVLSGGGARGLAHVGALKVLEELRIPIDVVTGTSMGAIVGGLYASGMSAIELERELKAVRWSDVFASRVERKQLSQRRKEEDFEVSALVELGVRNGELLAPSSAVSSRGLETLLRRYTLPVRGVRHFDNLPIPFRAVATDMETGESIVLDQGDLALALRSSMSVPGVFAPTMVDGRVLGDGGLVNNLPIDVARALGADVVIVVNIGTPLAPRDTLNSAMGLTTQMVNILTEQNVQRSLATMRPNDVLITPALGRLTSADFEKTLQFIELGEAGARGSASKLGSLSLDKESYAIWRNDRPLPGAVAARLAAVRIEGTTRTNPDRLLAMLENKPGLPFDAARAERDTRRLAAGGDYTRSDYQLAHSPDGDTLVFDLEDKPWGPNYLTAGLDLNTDLRGNSAFNLKVSHNRHWLTQSGTEWRNRVQIGEVPMVYTELYHPLNWTSSTANDWFVSGYASLERQRLVRYSTDGGEELVRFWRNQGTGGLDLGQPWGEFGELRLSWTRLALHVKPELVSAGFDIGPLNQASWVEDALRVRAVVDQLDFAVFPQSGYRTEVQAWSGRRSGDLTGSFYRLEGEFVGVRTFGTNTLEAYAQIRTAEQRSNINIARYSLGGFERLSGFQNGQLIGNHTLLFRAGIWHRLTRDPSVTRGTFVGATLEAGNAWMQRSDVKLSNLRTGMSAYLGLDTGVGPLYLGLTYAPQGRTGLVLSLGRP